jgi:hypothetical protein
MHVKSRLISAAIIISSATVLGSVPVQAQDRVSSEGQRLHRRTGRWRDPSLTRKQWLVQHRLEVVRRLSSVGDARRPGRLVAAGARTVRRERRRFSNRLLHQENFAGARADHDSLLEMAGVIRPQHIDAAAQCRRAHWIEPHGTHAAQYFVGRQYSGLRTRTRRRVERR